MGMKKDWNNRASENAMGRIIPHNSEEGFWNGGESEAGIIANYFGKDKVYFDIGCGIGRISIPLAEQVKKVFAYDVSENMVATGMLYAKEKELSNLEWVVGDEYGDTISTYNDIDVFFERLVLHHIPTEYLVCMLGNIREAMSDTSVLMCRFSHTNEIDSIHYYSNIPMEDTWRARQYTSTDVNSILGMVGMVKAEKQITNPEWLSNYTLLERYND